MRKSISILLLFIALLSYSRQERDGRLIRVARIVSDHPLEAISILDSISYDELSSSDRHYYDFLSIKANDKAYVKHTNDSLILDVIKYYSGHEKDTLYAEALYYGGRVYSDMGDYPTALNYFQKSLDQLNLKEGNIELKTRVYRQTGRILNTIRLYEEAIPYLEESIKLLTQRKDTVSIVYDLQLLGSTYRKNGNYLKAESLFSKALFFSDKIPISINAMTKMHLADLKRRQGNIDSSLLLIRNCPEEIPFHSWNKALSLATAIYLTADIPDTAFYYATKLINSKDDDHKTVAYKALLSPEMINYLHRDSIVKYVLDYRALVEKMYNENSNKLALEQRTHYNYQIQERERIKAEKSNRNIKNFVFILIFTYSQQCRWR